MKKALLVIIGAVLISGCSRWSAPTEKMAKDYLQSRECMEKIGLRYEVLEFKKTNGIKGTGDYKLIYTAKIKMANNVLIWTGEIIFQKAETGWLPVDNNVKEQK